jgi:hypothetical protein
MGVVPIAGPLELWDRGAVNDKGRTWNRRDASGDEPGNAPFSFWTAPSRGVDVAKRRSVGERGGEFLPPSTWNIRFRL